MGISLKHILIVGFLFRLVLAFSVWHPDLNNHVDWGIRFFEYGPQKFYAPESNVWSYTWPNQPPGTILLFAAVRKLFEFKFNLLMYINTTIPAFPSGVMFFFEDTLYQAMLKMPSIIADLGIAYILFRFFADSNKHKAGILAALFYVFNPVVWYNSAVWGQTDAVINFFSIAALYVLLKRNIVLAALLLAASLYIKISLAIFVPIFVIIALRQKYRIQDYVGAIVLPVLIIVTITFLFSGNSDPIVWLYEIYSKRVLTNQLQVITANAFNIWAIITGIHEQPHTLPLLGSTYQTWGNILFAALYVPLLVRLWMSQKTVQVMWVFALCGFASWMFLTNMHERYLYPLFPFFTYMAIEMVKLRVMYVLVSAISMLNLYNYWFTPRIEPVVTFLSVGDRIMPRVLGLVNLLLFGILYIRFLNHAPKRYN